MEKIILKECYKHGLTEHVLDSSGRYRCKECRKQAVNEKRRRNKLKLVEYKGGKCEKCGYHGCIDALEFHHLDPNEKDFSISSGNYKSLAIMKKEVDKCMLVCSNCHKEIHFKENEEKREMAKAEIEKNKANFILAGRKPRNWNIISTLPEEIIEECKNKKQKEVAEKYGISVSTLKRFLKSKRNKEYEVNKEHKTKT